MSSDKSAKLRPGEGRREESARRIREALRRELDKQPHRRRQIEAAVDRSPGYFYKYISGKLKMTIDLLLDTLDVMGIDPGRFFANALGASVSAEALLEDLEEAGEIDRALAEIERAARRLETAAPNAGPEREGDPEDLLAEVLACRGVEQRRRLGAGEKYRSAAFAAAYLEHLDALRYDDPREAALGARAVALKLVPRLGAPQSERLALLVTAIGVYGSACRVRGHFATAARAARVGLELARRHGLARETARMLQRGASVLIEVGRFSAAKRVVDEALLMCFDADSDEELATVQVDRGVILNYLGQHRGAIRDLRRALLRLPKDSRRTTRNRFAACQVLALAYENLGELDRAEAELARAVEEFKDAGALNWAKLVWQHGRLAFQRRSLDASERRLRRAFAIFERAGDPDRALVALDLARTLLARGELGEAAVLAVDMTRYLKIFRRNRIAAAAITGLSQTAAAGGLTLEKIEQAQRDLGRALAGKPARRQRGLGT